jgi:hypothetical protein
MNYRSHIRILAMGSLLTLSVVAIPATQAFAKPKRTPDPGIRCSIVNADGSYDFYLPGESIQRDGFHWVCTASGEWVVYRAPSGPLAGPFPTSYSTGP